MEKLKQLQSFVKELFDKAETTDKTQIDNLVKISNSLEEISKETSEIENKNVELIKSYKDLIKHTSFKNDNIDLQQSNLDKDIDGAKAPDLEEFLLNFAKNQKN